MQGLNKRPPTVFQIYLIFRFTVMGHAIASQMYERKSKSKFRPQYNKAKIYLPLSLTFSLLLAPR
jgi:hypothetical protein